MMVHMLILFISAVIVQHAALPAPRTDPASPEHITSPADVFSPLRLRGYSVMEQRDAEDAEDASLCFLLREKDEEKQLSCKHRLNLRSKFNYNPFGLRFGKRGARSKSAGERRRRGRLLPVLLLLDRAS
ncbi:kisspeptin 2 precursor [Astyanax mexicanus]|uniref:Kisspeptin 2 n=1 Tax=Astyanax mexicanus TaxID=7994 RepID=A0A8T2M6G6_ASTMX|nr:kisspeptin 2 precursor [Astyanax mexicanus]